MSARRIETPPAHGVVHKLVLATSTFESRLAIAVSTGLRSSLRRTLTTLLPVHLRARSTQRSRLAREFNSSSSSALGEQFWWLCVVPFLDPENASLRVGESWFSAKSQWHPIRAPLPSFSSASSSMHGLFAHWRKGDLTRPLFLDYVGSDSAAKYFSGAAPPSGGFGMPLRTTAVGRTFIGEYIIKFNPTFTNTPGDLVTEGTWQDAWWVALWCDAFWLTWFLDDSSMCASWRPLFFDGFSESARRVPRRFNGCSEKCP